MELFESSGRPTNINVDDIGAHTQLHEDHKTHVFCTKNLT